MLLRYVDQVEVENFSKYHILVWITDTALT